MCAKSVVASHDSPSRRPIHRFRFARTAKHMDTNDAKLALDIIIRPSLQLWKLTLGRSVLTAFKRSKRTTLLGDNTSSTSSTTPKKVVRFDEKPVLISPRGFFDKWRKDSSSSPARPCLVIRENSAVSKKHLRPSLETDTHSVYEDCLSDHTDFLVDLQVLEGDAQSDTRSLRRIRRSEFYEMESGIAMFDRTGYANYCLSRWLEKQRKGTQTHQKRVFDPGFVSWPNLTLPLPPPTSNPLAVACPVPPLSAATCRPPRSLPWRICKYIEDELQNAIVVLIIGLSIHICLFLFLLYDILARGFVPSDD